jgi:hypothetical protein
MVATGDLESRTRVEERLSGHFTPCAVMNDFGVKSLVMSVFDSHPSSGESSS